MIESAVLAPVPAPETLIIGVIVALGAFLSPLLSATITNRAARRVRMDDYARQDEIALRLSNRQDTSEKNAADVASQAAEAARLLVASNQKQEQLVIVQTAKLDQIHTLVNSNLTAAIQDQCDARSATLVLLEAIVETRRAAKLPDNVEMLAQIELNRLKIVELTKQLADRSAQTMAADSKLKLDLDKSNQHT